MMREDFFDEKMIKKIKILPSPSHLRRSQMESTKSLFITTRICHWNMRMLLDDEKDNGKT